MMQVRLLIISLCLLPTVGCSRGGSTASRPNATLDTAQDEPEKLYRQAEEKLAEVQTFLVVSEVSSSGERGELDGDGRADARLVVEGNQFHLLYKKDAAVVSDGKTMSLWMPNGPFEVPVPKNLEQGLRQVFVRAGLFGVFWPGIFHLAVKREKEFDVEKMLPISDFKMGTAEKIGGRNAKVIAFKISPREALSDGKEEYKVTLWLDSETMLPRKHIVVVVDRSEGKGAAKDKMRVTTMYTIFDLNPKLDPKDFELSK